MTHIVMYATHHTHTRYSCTSGFTVAGLYTATGDQKRSC